jgi:hypothetical protein
MGLCYNNNTTKAHSIDMVSIRVSNIGRRVYSNLDNGSGNINGTVIILTVAIKII